MGFDEAPRILSILLPPVTTPTGKSARMSRGSHSFASQTVRDVPVIAELTDGHDPKDLTSLTAEEFVPRYARIRGLLGSRQKAAGAC